MDISLANASANVDLPVDSAPTTTTRRANAPRAAGTSQEKCEPRSALSSVPEIGKVVRSSSTDSCFAPMSDAQPAP